MDRSCFREIPFMGVIHVNVRGDEAWLSHGRSLLVQPGPGPAGGRRDPRRPAPDQHHRVRARRPRLWARRGVCPSCARRSRLTTTGLYRAGKASQYTAENVCVSPGGRAGLTRTAATFDNARLGYFTPDYTAYGGHADNVFPGRAGAYRTRRSKRVSDRAG